MSEELKYHYKYPHPAVTTDCVIFGFDDSKLQILLIERGLDPFKGKWALPGGFLRMNDEDGTGAPDANTMDCAKRELKEETGLDQVEVEQLQAFSQHDRDPREWVITVAYYALVRIANCKPVQGGDDARQARWFDINDLPELAFDHREIIDKALQRLRERLHFEFDLKMPKDRESSTIASQLLSQEFTMPQLHSLCEQIMGEPLDRRNFNKKMNSRNLIRSLTVKSPRCQSNGRLTVGKKPTLCCFTED